MKENHLSQKEVAGRLDWPESKVSCIISGKNHHKGDNQTGVYKRDPKDCMLLACVIDMDPQFRHDVAIARDPVLYWFLHEASNCLNWTDLMEKAAADGKPWFEEQQAKDELPDADE